MFNRRAVILLPFIIFYFMSWFSKILSPILSVGGAAASVVGVATGQPWLAALGSQAGSLGAGLGQQNTNEALMQNQRFLQEDAQSFNADQAQISRDFNAEQAQISRDFNAEQSQLQRNWSESMWMKQNEYNSPSNQLKLMQEAGLNPNMFNQNVAGATSPTPGSSASSSPASSSSASVGTPSVPNLQTPELMMAQSRLLNAQADKAESDVDVNKQTANRIRALLDGELKTQQGVLRLQASQEHLNYSTARKYYAEGEKLLSDAVNNQQLWHQIKAQTELLQHQGQLTKQQVDIFQQRWSLEVAKSLSEIAELKARRVQLFASAEEARAAASEHRAGALLKETETRKVANEAIKSYWESGQAALYFLEQNSTMPKRIELFNSQAERGIVDADFDVKGLHNFAPVLRGINRSFGVSPLEKLMDFQQQGSKAVVPFVLP